MTTEEAFIEPKSTEAAGIKLRPMSYGSIAVAKKLGLSMFFGGNEVSPDEQQRQVIAFAWMQSRPVDEVLRAIWSGEAEREIERFGFTVSLHRLGEIIEEIKRVSELAASARFDIEPKPGEREENAPPNC